LKSKQKKLTHKSKYTIKQWEKILNKKGINYKPKKHKSKKNMKMKGGERQGRPEAWTNGLIPQSYGELYDSGEVWSLDSVVNQDFLWQDPTMWNPDFLGQKLVGRWVKIGTNKGGEITNLTGVIGIVKSKKKERQGFGLSSSVTGYEIVFSHVDPAYEGIYSPDVKGLDGEIPIIDGTFQVDNKGGLPGLILDPVFLRKGPADSTEAKHYWWAGPMVPQGEIAKVIESIKEEGSKHGESLGMGSQILDLDVSGLVGAPPSFIKEKIEGFRAREADLLSKIEELKKTVGGVFEGLELEKPTPPPPPLLSEIRGAVKAGKAGGLKKRVDPVAEDNLLSQIRGAVTAGALKKVSPRKPTSEGAPEAITTATDVANAIRERRIHMGSTSSVESDAGSDAGWDSD